MASSEKIPISSIDGLAAALSAVGSHTYSKILYVDPVNGNDSNTGQFNSPFLTVGQAWIARMALGNTVRVAIKILGTSHFPSSLTLDGTVGGSDSMLTYIMGVAGPAGRWESAFSTLNLYNVGYLYVTGFASYGTITLKSDTWVSYLTFNEAYLTSFNVAISGVATKVNQLSFYACVVELNNVTGDTSKTNMSAYRGSVVWQKQTATLESMRVMNAAWQIFPAKTLTITNKVDLFDNGSVVLRGSATLAGGTINNYGGHIAKDAGSTVTSALSNVSRVWSKHHYFEPGVSGIVATNVEDAIKEVAASGGDPTQGAWYVHRLGDDTTGTGSPDNPFLTIQKAIDTASEGDTIYVGQGQFNGAITFKLNVIIRGWFRNSYQNDNGACQISPVTCVLDQTLADGDTGLEIVMHNVNFNATMTKTGPNYGIIIRAYNCIFSTSATLVSVVNTIEIHNGEYTGKSVSLTARNSQLTNIETSANAVISNCWQTSTAYTVTIGGSLDIYNSHIRASTVNITTNLNQRNTVFVTAPSVGGTTTTENQGGGGGPELAKIYVDKGGNDTTGDGSPQTPYLTIGKATSVASAGDTIYIGIGDYTETVTIPANVSLEGASGHGYSNNATYKGVKIIGNTATVTSSNYNRLANILFNGNVTCTENTSTFTSELALDNCRVTGTLYNGSTSGGNLVFAYNSYIGTWDTGNTGFGFNYAIRSEVAGIVCAWGDTMIGYDSLFITVAPAVGSIELYNCHIETLSAFSSGAITLHGSTIRTDNHTGVGAGTLSLLNPWIERVTFKTTAIKTLSAGGVATAGKDRNLIIAANSGVADDMIEITGLSIGDEVLLTADTGDTITVKHNSGSATIKIILTGGADCVLSETHPIKLVLMSSTTLVEVRDRQVKQIGINASDFTTIITTGENKGYQTVPFDCTIVGLYAHCMVAGPSGSNTTIDVHKNGTTIMTTTKITIETTETSSLTATTQPVLTTTSLSKGDVLTVGFDAVAGTEKGVIVVLDVIEK